MGGLNQIYIASLLLKGFNALLECGLGAFLGVYKSADMHSLLLHWFDGPFFHGKGAWIASSVLDYSASVPEATHSFFAIYLMLHGLAKVVLVSGLLAKKNWAYPLALAALSGFILYQIFRYMHSHALGLVVLTVFDILVLAMIVNDYFKSKKVRTLAG
jgi:uncharacterized membrane protein